MATSIKSISPLYNLADIFELRENPIFEPSKRQKYKRKKALKSDSKRFRK